MTGPSKGISASIAKHLAAAGAAVIVNYAASKPGADQTVAEIAAAGGKASAIQALFKGISLKLKTFPGHLRRSSSSTASLTFW